MAAEPSKRPQFADIVSELQQLRAQLEGVTGTAKMCKLSVAASPDHVQGDGTVCAA